MGGNEVTKKARKRINEPVHTSVKETSPSVYRLSNILLYPIRYETRVVQLLLRHTHTCTHTHVYTFVSN